MSALFNKQAGQEKKKENNAVGVKQQIKERGPAS